MKELGLNAIRLRVWVNPKGGFSSKEDVLVMAKRRHSLFASRSGDGRELQFTVVVIFATFSLS